LLAAERTPLCKMWHHCQPSSEQLH